MSDKQHVNFHHNFLKVKGLIPWVIIALSILTALAFFIYSIRLPESNRIRGDAYSYLAIAGSFASFHDAISYIGVRTYGYPLFLYLIKSIISPVNLNRWAIATAYVQFVFHMISCLLFYLFFLKLFFKKAGLSNITASVTAAMLITYPVLVTYTTIPLTDTFSVDLLMMAVVFYQAINQAKNIFVAITHAFICGSFIGYAAMVRPVFYLPMAAFYICFIWITVQRRKYRTGGMSKISAMLVGSLLLILPTITHFYITDGKISFQNEAIPKAEVRESLNSGLSAVRVFWSKNSDPSASTPGVRDPFLQKNYASRCVVYSVKDLFQCLISKPLAIPFYFGKKMIALFDTPHIQPYAVDITPRWFPYVTRLFEVWAFCGFITLLILTPFFLFLKKKFVWIDLPWAVFAIAFIFQQTLFHVEGRYGFPAIPFSIVAFFLGFAASRMAGNKFILLWSSAMIISGFLFFYQLHAWDVLQSFTLKLT